jgi:general stress protein CsbA
MIMMHVPMILVIPLTDVITQKYGAMIMTHVLLIGAIVVKVAKPKRLNVMITMPVRKTLVISKKVANTN